jgi:hypothetical protein
MIYTSGGFWNSIGGASATWAKKYPLALAQWPRDLYILNFSPTLFTAEKLAWMKNQIETGIIKPKIPLPWTELAIWQFTSRAAPKAVLGYVGIKKAVDMNKIYLTPQVVEPPKVCPTCLRLLP